MALQFFSIAFWVVPMVLVIHSCTSKPKNAEPPIQTTTAIFSIEDKANFYEEEETQEILTYTPDGWPVYEEDILPPPEEYIYDEYGVMYQLVDGTYDEYQIVEDYVDEVETSESTAFTYLWYWPAREELTVEFRQSGAAYIYYDVPVEVWYSFKTADSKGSFFNSEIKGQYEYERDY